MSIGIDVQHLVTHVHSQNRLAKSSITLQQLIARPLLLKTKLPLLAWGHAIIHATNLISLRSTTNHDLSPLLLAKGYQPNISHFRVFGCAVYVPISPTHRPKLGPQRRLGIYVDFQSASIINYIEPLTGKVFTARFVDCHFDENLFLPLGGDRTIQKEWREITWNESSLSHLDPRTKQSELEVQKIIHLQGLANQLPNAFIDSTKVTKSHIPTANIPARIEIPTGKLQSSITNVISMTLEDHITVNTQVDEQVAPVEALIKELSLNDVPIHNNEEISINYIHKGKIWD